MAPADTLVCDTAQVAAWQSDPAFAYSRELIAPEINVLSVQQMVRQAAGQDIREYVGGRIFRRSY